MGRFNEDTGITGYTIALKSLREASFELASLLNTGRASSSDIRQAADRVLDNERSFRPKYLREVALARLSTEGNQEAADLLERCRELNYRALMRTQPAGR